MPHLINGLPTIGSLWRMVLAPETLGRVTAVESPASTAHEYYIQIDTETPESPRIVFQLQFSVGLGEFKRTWQPHDLPRPEGKSAWDRLIWGDDLV